MILKSSTGRNEDLIVLQRLLEESNQDSIKKKITQEIKNIRAGERGEKESAYEIDFHFASSNNIAVIHDIRLEHNGFVAQIDHLWINRLMQIYVCESKHFSEGISINDHGEFTAFYNKVPYGVPSPIEQNNRHIQILKNIFKDGSNLKIPMRLGMPIVPSFHSVILVSKNARINRPQKHFAGLENIIKTDSIGSFLNKEEPTSGISGLFSVVNSVSKICSAETIHALASDLVKLDKPIKFDWIGKFGMTNDSIESPKPSDIYKSDEHKKTKLLCSKCETKVDYAVAKFCWFNKSRFGGNVFCRDCQISV